MDSLHLRHNQSIKQHGELRGHLQLQRLGQPWYVSFRESNGGELQQLEAAKESAHYLHLHRDLKAQ